jgi:hypothetical protein
VSLRKTGKAGPPAGPAHQIATSKQHRQSNQDNTCPVVFATLLLATTGAVFDRLLVKSCVWCQFAHVHHAPVGLRHTPLVRSPRCSPHRRYAIEITSVVPASTIPGQRRRGAAA